MIQLNLCWFFKEGEGGKCNRVFSKPVCEAYLFFFNLFILIYLFLAVLGLHCWARALSSCGERGPLSAAVHRPLIAVASPAAEHRLQARRPQQLWHVGSAAAARGL